MIKSGNAKMVKHCAPLYGLFKKAPSIFAITLLPNRRGLVIQRYRWLSIVIAVMISSINKDLSIKHLLSEISLYCLNGVVLFKKIPTVFPSSFSSKFDMIDCTVFFKLPEYHRLKSSS